MPFLKKATIVQKRKEQVVYFLKASSRRQNGLFIYQIMLKACRIPRSYHSLKSEAMSVRIRFHVVFIENASFSLHVHLASIRKRSKTIIVFTKKRKLLRTVSRRERIEKAMILRSFSLKTQTFENDATATTNYLKYIGTQTIDFCWFLRFSIVFIVFE